MKKKIAGILAAIMVLSMGTTVLAANSPDVQSDLEQKAESYVTTVSVDTENVVLSVKSVETSDLKTIYDVVSEKAGVGCEVLAAVDISSKTTIPNGGIELIFMVEGITSGTRNIRIYHKISTGWEVKTPFVGNGYVIATFDSLSPFFIVKYDSTPATGDGSVDSSTIVNNYYTTNNTDSNNTTNNTTNNTDSNNTNSNNTTSTTNSGNTSTTTINNNAAEGSTKSSTDSSSGSKKKTTSTDTTNMEDSSKTPTNANDNSSNNNQNVTVNVSDNGSSSGKSGTSTATTSPKTGASLPALPMIALFAAMGIAVCNKKARSLR